MKRCPCWDTFLLCKLHLDNQDILIVGIDVCRFFCDALNDLSTDDKVLIVTHNEYGNDRYGISHFAYNPKVVA